MEEVNTMTIYCPTCDGDNVKLIKGTIFKEGNKWECITKKKNCPNFTVKEQMLFDPLDWDDIDLDGA